MLENLRKGHKSNKIGSLQEVDRGHGSSQTNSRARSFALRKTHRTGALQGAETGRGCRTTGFLSARDGRTRKGPCRAVWCLGSSSLHSGQGEELERRRAEVRSVTHTLKANGLNL